MQRRLKQQAVGEQVRRLRAQVGMTLRTLARQAGFSASFISQLEHGQVSPSISSMERIAGVLGVSLVEFFASVSQADGGLVVRAAQRQELNSGWSNSAVEAVSPHSSLARLEVLMIRLRPGGRSGKHPYAHPREEFAFVLSGRVNLTLGPEQHALGPGDAACILPGELRLWHNESRRNAQVLIVTSPLSGSPIRGSKRPAGSRAPRAQADGGGRA